MSTATRFPILALIARKYLGILASSASNKRFFFQGALIITKLHNKLNKSTFEMISCLKSWGLFKDKLEEAKKEEEKGRERRKN
jgi:ribosomal protein L4